jgi:hypothetical protein
MSKNKAFSHLGLIGRFFLKVGLSLGVFLAMMVILEVILRLTKEPPWQPDLVPFRVEPGGKLYEDDPILGFRLKPGCFDVFMANGTRIRTTHLPEHERATGPVGAATGRPEIWILGCSYTYGWSVSDEETYPWLVQNALPGLRIRNLGVPGYNNVQSLLWMGQKIQEGGHPQQVVLAYASFHDERNAGLRRWQKTLIRPRDGGLGPQAQPNARLDAEGQLCFSEKPEKLWEIPGMRIFSIPHSIEKRWAKIEANAVPTIEISRRVIAQKAAEAKAAGATFLLAGIENDTKTRQMLESWRAQGGRTVDISVDLNQPGLRNFPHDSHPGPKAHRSFALRLLEALPLQNSKP